MSGSNDGRSALCECVEGDFDASVDWTAAFIATTGNGSLVVVAEFVAFGLDEADGGTESMSVVQRPRETGQQCAPSVDVCKSLDSVLGDTGCMSSLTATNADPGSFRMTREGSVHTAIVYDADNPDWLRLRRSTVSDKPVYFSISSFGFFATTSTVCYNFIVSPLDRYPADTNDDCLRASDDFNS